MDTETPVDDYCEPWQGDKYKDGTLPEETTCFDRFYIEIYAEFTYPTRTSIEEEEEEESADLLHLQGEEKFEEFWARCDRLKRGNLDSCAVSRVLDKMGVPANKQPFMLEKICRFADEIANAPYNQSKKVMHMIVSIGVVMDRCMPDDENGDVLAAKDDTTVEMR